MELQHNHLPSSHVRQISRARWTAYPAEVGPRSPDCTVGIIGSGLGKDVIQDLACRALPFKDGHDEDVRPPARLQATITNYTAEDLKFS